MPFIEDLDKMKRWNTYVTIGTIVGAFIFCVLVVLKAFSFAQAERKRIYVLDEDTPILAKQVDEELTIEVEAKAHINLFHQLFFTLAPDDKYINHNLEKSMYLIDESGLAQKNTLQEKGFYSNIISASATFAIMTDSIKFNKDDMSFIYYGKQRIERKTSILYRELVTTGKISKSTRTENNPHGLMIINYRTLQNKDLEYKTKNTF